MKDLIVGLALLVLGAWGVIEWWDDFGEFLRGIVPIVLILGGLAAVGSGFQKTVLEARGQKGFSEEPGEDDTSKELD